MNIPEVDPPRIALRFFRWFCNPDCRDDIEGDLHEIFQKNVEAKGARKARWLFAINVLKLFRPGIIRPLKTTSNFNNYGMFRNYLFTAFRNMKREKLFSLMNIAGLAIGIGCGLVIYKIITYELSFNTYHKNYDNVYRVINLYNHPQYGTAYNEGQVHPLAEALRGDYPGLEAAMTFYAGDGQVTSIDNKGNADRFREYSGIAYAQPQFLKLFDFNFIAGDPEKALVNRGSAVITSSLAQKYFKLKRDEVSQAIGRSVTVNNAAITFMITGIMEDTPANSDMPFTFIGNYEDQVASNPYFNGGTDWQEYNSNTNCWIMTSGEMPAARVEQTLKDFTVKYNGKERASFMTYVLQPLSDLHYDTRVQNYAKKSVSYGRLTILGVIGLILVVSACINFINMSTAQAIKRAKEVGVRKSLGVRKRQLVFQFIGETIFISLLSSIAGLVIAGMLLMYLPGILGYTLQLNFTNVYEVLFMVAMVLGVGLLSGFYPALVMAGMNPIRALKNSLSAKGTSGLLSLRRGLVVTQFVISQVLIIGTIVAAQQMQYFLGNDIGFEKEAILVTKVPGSSPEQLDRLKTTMSSLAGVEKVSLNVASPMAMFRVNNPVLHPSIGKDDMVAGNLKTADESYIDLFHLKILAGRNLPPERDTKDAVVSRKLTQSLGHKTPDAALGDTFKYGRGDLEFRIIGVVEDFHTVSFHQDVENVILSNLPWNIREMAVKINTRSGNFADVQSTVNEIKAQWDKLYPETIFDYTFLDEQIAKMYQDEQKTSQLFWLFSAIAIFIGCLGLYGLVSYMANQKTKEIGIRKVMGASIGNIVAIFSKEMIMLVGIAFVLAAPLAWYVMDNWLQEFKYHVEMSSFFFVAALLISVVIAFITIGYKALVASSANPIDSLRSE